MKFFFSWLKEFIELSIPPESLAHRLTMAGLEVTDLTRVDRDWLFEAEVTPNRPDLLSHLGIAREAAAVLGRPFRFPRWLSRESQPPSPKGESPVSVSLQVSGDCRRYVGVVIEEVTVGPSPPEAAERLTRLGIRPVNNIVDATNLCLFELGQPLHAFDLDRLEGGTVVVRRAGAGETLVTLDGQKRALTPELLVIADARGPTALAGIMGGRDSEISASTRRVFLESAWFDPHLVRRAARHTRLVSDSSYRFERGVDPEGVAAAAFRAARLIARLGRGTIRGWTDTGHHPSRRRISVKPAFVREVLGLDLTPAQQRRIVERLGCRTKVMRRGWQVEPPSWRVDLKVPEDLCEEIARLWGYDRIPTTQPPFQRRPLPESGNLLPEDPGVRFEFEVREHLAAAGFQEILTYSLVSPADQERIGLERSDALALENPLSLEYSLLRRCLLMGTLQTVARNLHRKAAEAFRLFEIGCRYGPGAPGRGRAPDQVLGLSLAVAGVEATRWGQAPGAPGMLALKGTVAALFERLGLPLEERIAASPAHPYLRKPSVVWTSHGQGVGVAGEVDPRVLAAYELPDNCPMAYAELELEVLSLLARVPLRIRPLPKVPPVLRDLAIVVAQDVPHGEIVQAIRSAGRPLLQEAALFDLYQGKQVPAGKRGLAFHLWFSAGDRTLTDPEVAEAVQKIRGQLSSGFQAELR